jgi:hypothetical protein
MARPTSYRPEYAEQARKLCELGATDVEIADFFEVAVSTFYLWKNKQPEFSEALKAGKEASDERVERSLYHKAIGYTFESEKVFQHQGVIVRTPTREHVPPDTTAMIFWLKNRRPQAWREKTEQVILHGNLDDLTTEQKREYAVALATELGVGNIGSTAGETGQGTRTVN